MALTPREAALIAASKVSTQRVSAIADDYEDWIGDQVTSADAVLALLEASGTSKNPATVMTNAQAVYDSIESDPATVTSVTRTGGAAAGAQAGGTIVSIVGTNLTEVTSVTFGGVAGTALTHDDDTHLTVTTPAHAAGAVNVVAVSAEGNGTLTNGYTYV